MIYLVTNSFNTASWIYFGRREEGGRIMNIDDKINNSILVVHYIQKSFYLGLQGLMLKELYNVLQWSEMPSGGHLQQWKNQIY